MTPPHDHTWTERQREGMRLNRLAWDERVEAHWRSAMYTRHAEALRVGGHCLGGRVVEQVGDVRGRALIHLQCHMGMETLSWSRLGADAVGLDFSRPAIDKAELLRDELGLGTRFLCANVYDAVEAAGATFDVVFVSIGALCWLPDVRRWARVVAALLRPGGWLYLDEAHPFMDVFDDHPDGASLQVRYPYACRDGLTFDEDGSYAATDATFTHTRTMDWSHGLGDVVTALIEAGLVIDRLDESPRCVWPRFKMMTQTDVDSWSLPGPVLHTLPNMYTLWAHRA